MPTELIVGFNGGEVSRNIESRVDLPLYKRSCSIMENFDVLPEGGARNRSGTKFIGKTKGTTLEGDETAHLIDFSYSDDQSYIFEFGELYLRIYRVQDESLVQDLVTPYSIDDVKTLQWDRSYDVMWLVHPNYPDQTLTRTTVSNFTLADTVYDSPPMLDENITATTITPSGYTGNISLLASTGIFQAGHVGSYWTIKQDRTTALEAPAGFQRGLQTPIVPSGSSKWLFVGFSDWRVETGGTWTGQVKAELSQDQGATISDTIIIADTTGAVAENYIYDSTIRGGKNEWIRITCTSGTTGNIRTDDVLTYGLVKITAFTDSQNVDAEVISELYDTSATKRWSEGSFSDVNGYPRTITLFEERRWLSGTNAEPNMVWGSTTDDFYNYFIGTRDDESIRRAPPVNGFSTWLDSKEQLFLCTTNELITITGLTSSQGLTPENFKFNVQSGFGSEYLQNELTNDVILYVEKGRKKLRELIYSRDELNFQSNDVSALSKHITKQGIGTTALQKLPDQRLMCVLDNGQLAPFTYERTEEIIAWQRYVTDGNYESVAVTPNGDVDSTWYVVERDGEHFIEIQQIRDDNSYWFLDSAVEFDGGDAVTNVTIEVLPNDSVKVTSPLHGLLYGETIKFSNVIGFDYLNTIEFNIDPFDVNSFILMDTDNNNIDYLLSAEIPDILAEGGGDDSVNGYYTIKTKIPEFVYGKIGSLDQEMYTTGSTWKLEGDGLVTIYGISSSERLPPMGIWPIVIGASPAPTISYNSPYVSNISGDYCKVTNVVDGLDHLEGKEIGVICDKNNDGTYVVVSGTVNLNGYCNQAIAGLPYASTLSPLPIELIAQTFTVGRQKSVVDMVIKLKDSIGGLLGSDLNNMSAIAGRTIADPIGEQLEPINDDIKSYSLDSWEIIKRIYIQQDLPLPFEVLSISMDVRGKGR